MNKPLRFFHRWVVSGVVLGLMGMQVFPDPYAFTGTAVSMRFLRHADHGLLARSSRKTNRSRLPEVFINAGHVFSASCPPRHFILCLAAPLHILLNTVIRDSFPRGPPDFFLS